MNPINNARAKLCLSPEPERRRVAIESGGVGTLQARNLTQCQERLLFITNRARITVPFATLFLSLQKDLIIECYRNLKTKYTLCRALASVFSDLSPEEAGTLFANWLNKPGQDDVRPFILGIAHFLSIKKQKSVANVVVQAIADRIIDLGVVLNGVTFDPNICQESRFFKVVFRRLGLEAGKLGESPCVIALRNIGPHAKSLPVLFNTFLSLSGENAISCVIACLKNMWFVSEAYYSDVFYRKNRDIANLFLGDVERLTECWDYWVKDAWKNIVGLSCVCSVIMHFDAATLYNKIEYLPVLARGFSRGIVSSPPSCRAYVLSAVINGVCKRSSNSPDRFSLIETLFESIFFNLSESLEEEKYLALFKELDPSPNAVRVVLKILSSDNSQERFQKCLENSSFVNAAILCTHFFESDIAFLFKLFNQTCGQIQYTSQPDSPIKLLHQIDNQVFAFLFILRLGECNLAEMTNKFFQKNIGDKSEGEVALILSDAFYKGAIARDILLSQGRGPPYRDKGFFRALIQKLKVKNGEAWCLRLIPLIFEALHAKALLGLEINEFLYAFLPCDPNVRDLEARAVLRACFAHEKFAKFKMDLFALKYLVEATAREILD